MQVNSAQQNKQKLEEINKNLILESWKGGNEIKKKKIENFN